MTFCGADSSSASDFDVDYSRDETDSSTTHVESEEMNTLVINDVENAEPVREVQNSRRPQRPRKRRCRCRLNDNWKRICGLCTYLLLMASMAVAARQLKSYTNCQLEQTFSIIALLIVLITVSLLYYTEATRGKGLELWRFPILCNTLLAIRGMWIANIGFGFALCFSIAGQASSISSHKTVSVFLMVTMGVSLGFVIFFRIDEYRGAHDTAVIFFVLLLATNIIVEVVWAPDSEGPWHSGGWFQVALSMVILSFLIPCVEDISRVISGSRSCAVSGEWRNQLYLHFSLLFYLVGMVVRSFR